MYKTKYIKYKTKYLKLFKMIGGGNRLNIKNVGKLVIYNGKVGVLVQNNEIYQLLLFNGEIITFQTEEDKNMGEKLSEDMFKVIITTSDYLLLVKYRNDILRYINALPDDNSGIFTSIKMMNLHKNILLKLQSDIESIDTSKFITINLSIDFFLNLDSVEFVTIYKKLISDHIHYDTIYKNNIRKKPIVKEWIIIKPLLDILLSKFEQHQQIMKSLKYRAIEAKILLDKTLDCTESQKQTCDILIDKFMKDFCDNVDMYHILNDQITSIWDEIVILYKYNDDVKKFMSDQTRQLTHMIKFEIDNNYDNFRKTSEIYRNFNRKIERFFMLPRHSAEETPRIDISILDDTRAAADVDDNSSVSDDDECPIDNDSRALIDSIDTPMNQELRRADIPDEDELRTFTSVKKKSISNIMYIYLYDQEICDNINREFTEFRGIEELTHVLFRRGGDCSRYIDFFNGTEKIGYLTIHSGDKDVSLETRYHYKFKKIVDGKEYKISFTLIYINNKFIFIRVLNEPFYKEPIDEIHTKIMDLICTIFINSLLNPTKLLATIFSLLQFSTEAAKRKCDLYRVYFYKK